MLMAAAVISYTGAFTSSYRGHLINELVTFLRQRQVPMTHGLQDPLKVLHVVLHVTVHVGVHVIMACRTRSRCCNSCCM